MSKKTSLITSVVLSVIWAWSCHKFFGASDSITFGVLFFAGWWATDTFKFIKKRIRA